MILLLCMTVGVFSACTGDDGASRTTRASRDRKEIQVNPADIEDDRSHMVTYSFLKSWGSDDRRSRIGCSDPILTGR